MTAEQSAELFSKVPFIANKIVSNLHAKGMNILQNNEEIAGQTVFHTHIHLIPRFDENDGFVGKFTAHDYDLAEIAKEINDQ